MIISNILKAVKKAPLYFQVPKAIEQEKENGERYKNQPERTVSLFQPVIDKEKKQQGQEQYHRGFGQKCSKKRQCREQSGHSGHSLIFEYQVITHQSDKDKKRQGHFRKAEDVALPSLSSGLREPRNGGAAASYRRWGH